MVIGALGLLAATQAEAVPTFTNSNFIDSFAGPNYYGIPSGWTFSGFGTGSAPQDTAAFWDNGAAPGGPSRVGFIQNITGSTQGSLSQSVTGFTIGDTYTISVAANSRTPVASILDIILNGTTTLLASVIAPVEASGSFTTPFGNYVSATFTAAATTNTISFMNGSLGADTALLLSAATITDTTVPTTAVPEPISIALLGVGLVGLGVARRARAS